VWAVVSPEEQIELGELQLVRSDFVGLERAIQNVLASIDPALDLPPERRWQAAILGRSRLHSREMRRGLAVTLALLGARGTNIDLGDGLTAAAWTTGLVSALLNRANNDESIQLWSSLSDVLPLLAEAGPDQFLNALANAVRMDEFAAQMFLDDQGSSFTTSSPHTGMLWALEVAAWDRQTFGRAADLLAQLDEMDQGGRLQNRPFGSLLSILRLLRPQTLASTEERFQVLDALVERHPEVGIRLMIALLPGESGIIFDTARPRFRLQIEEEDTDLQEYAERVGMVVDRVLAKLNQDASLWPSVIPRIADLPPDDRSQMFDAVATADNLTESDGIELWRVASDLLRHHREYSDAPWALSQQDLDKFDDVIGRLSPENTSVSSRWLFDEMYPGIRAADISSAEESLRTIRTESIRLIAEAQGLDGILDFSRNVKIPALVGYSLPDAGIIEDVNIARLFDDPGNEVVAMVGGYFRRRAETEPDLLLRLGDELTDRPVIQARLLSHVPQLTSAWTKLAESDVQVQEVYWREFRITGRGMDFALTNQAARHLLDNGHPGKALDLMNIYLNGDEESKPEPQYIAEALEALVTSGANSYPISPYQIESSIEYLRATSFDDRRTAQLEWSFLQALGKEGGGILLERKLATDPQFFVQIISYAYKRTSDDADDADSVTPQLARNAHELLRMWKTVPGSIGRGESIDAAAFGQWYEEVSPLLQQADRYNVGMGVLGQTLAFAPGDGDGSWPCKPVRDFIEGVGDDNLDQGVHIGCFNKRGATWRSLREGGTQEYALAEKYRDLSERIVTTHPRVASILRSLADTYSADGRREDAEAQRRRQGIE
jgi:hypothetical protein